MKIHEMCPPPKKDASLSAGFLRKVVTGAVIGAAAIAPGLNGGVLASAAGVYEPAIHAIVHIRKEFRKSLAYLLPLAIGAAAGFFLFAVILKGIMDRQQGAVIMVFTGLVAGSIPSFLREANRGGFKRICLLGTVLALAAVITLAFSARERRMDPLPDYSVFRRPSSAEPSSVRGRLFRGSALRLS